MLRVGGGSCPPQSRFFLPQTGLLCSAQLPGSQRKRYLVPCRAHVSLVPQPVSLSAGQKHSTRESALSSTLRRTPPATHGSPGSNPFPEPYQCRHRKAVCSRGQPSLAPCHSQASYLFLSNLKIDFKYRFTMLYLISAGEQNVSVQFSHSVVSDSLRPHEPQHTRPPCPSPASGVHPNSCPLSR